MRIMIPGIDTRKPLKGKEVMQDANSCLVPGLAQYPRESGLTAHDEDLALVIRTWSRLPHAVREAVLLLLGTASPAS
jgi:hypothetical protein